jgi:uncharacterized protein involved in exopolysaccharide biosynthesis
LIVTLLAGILAFIFSLFIQPMYRSTAIVFAPQFNSFLVDNFEFRTDVKRYGHEYETEQLLQILNSRDFKDTLVRQFNLIEHFGIDTMHRHWKSKLYKELDNITIKRTQFGGIAITVSDRSPQMAAALANAMVDNLDAFKNRIEQERAQAVCDLLQRQIDEVNAQMIIVNDSVQKLANEGIFIFDLQVDRVMQQYATALGQGNAAGAQRIRKEIDNIAKWGPTSVILREELIYLVRRETLLKSLLWNAQMNASELMPSKFVVERAIPIEKKVFPKKSIITLFSAIAAFIVTFFVLLIIEKIKTNLPTYKKDE